MEADVFTESYGYRMLATNFASWGRCDRLRGRGHGPHSAPLRSSSCARNGPSQAAKAVSFRSVPSTRARPKDSFPIYIYISSRPTAGVDIRQGSRAVVRQDFRNVCLH